MNNKLRVTIILFIIYSFLTSCEGLVRGSGIVISSVDKSPIENVHIKWKSTETYTDSLGYFEIGEFVGCPFGCPDLMLTLTKNGYKMKIVNLTKENEGKIEVNRVTIELTPSNKTQGHK